MSQKIKIILKSIFILALFALSLSVFAAWQPPTAPPTGDNPEPPINVSRALQYKPGSVVADGLRAAYSFLTDSASLSTFNGPAIFNGTATFNGATIFNSSMAVSSMSVGNPAGTAGNINTNALGLNVYNSGSRYLEIRNNGSGADIISTGAPLLLNYSGGQNVSVGLNASPSYKLDVTGTLRNTLGANFATSSGNVGIGTATPGAKLEVVGQVKITGGTPGAGKVLTSDATGLASWLTPTGGSGSGVTATSGTLNRVTKFTSGSVIGDSTISDDGTSVKIGTVPASTTVYKLDVSGNVRLGTAIDELFIPGGATLDNGLAINSGGLQIPGGSVNIGTAAVPLSKVFIGGGSYNTVTNGANNAAYALGAQSIAANDSIYSYGAICSGNGYGDCKGSNGTVIGIVNTAANNNIPNVGNILLNSGNVGIGTATVTPGAKLEVGGQIKINGGLPGIDKVLTSDNNGFASWVTPEWTKNGSGLFYGKNILITNSSTSSVTKTGWWLENTGNISIGTENNKFVFINRTEAGVVPSPRLDCDGSDYYKDCGTFYSGGPNEGGNLGYDVWGTCPSKYKYDSINENCAWDESGGILAASGEETAPMTNYYNQYIYETRTIGSNTSENTTNLEVGSITTKKVTTTSGNYFNGKFYSNGTYSCSPTDQNGVVNDAGLVFQVTVTPNGFSSRCYVGDWVDSGFVN